MLTIAFTLPNIYFAEASVRFVDANKFDLVVPVKGLRFVQVDAGL